jgi:DNA-binding PadR family transcriptional regulator
MPVRNKSHLILALLCAPDRLGNNYGPIVGITRLEKLIFLVKKESSILTALPSEDDFNFRPYRMGPFTPEVYDEIDFLESLGLVESRKVGQDKNVEAVEDNLFFSNQILDKYQKKEVLDTGETREYRLSAEGKKVAKKIFDELPDGEKRFLMNLKRKFNDMDLKQLLRYIYQKYPTYAMQSEIKDYLGLK